MGGYDKEDWERMSSRLETAEENVARAREAARLKQKSQRQEYLDQAVLPMWSFAEYAVNVLLELSGRGPEQHHKHSMRLVEMKAQGIVITDYSHTLEQLARFRLRATYGGYSSNPSVHYSTANLTSCLKSLKALRDEVNAALDRHQKR